jgi:hypothetical protein
VDSETKELVERLDSAADAWSDHSLWEIILDSRNRITTQAAQIEELQATQLGMHDYVVQQAKRIEELAGALEARIHALRHGNLEDEGMADEMILTALSRLKREVA